MFVNNAPLTPLKSWPFKHTATVLALSLGLSGCSVLKEDKIDYKSAVKAPSLEVPPDLSQLRRESRYALESTSATASGFRNANVRVNDAGTAANQLGKVRMERVGDQRLLVVSMAADQVWPALREFWTSNGFQLSTDSPELGIMETDWAENRAKLPQDFIRRTLGKVLDSLYSTGERDKYRTRVERNAKGEVEIYITHRGMIENYATAQKDRTIWQARPSDPELEVEFLRRLMVKLGTSPQDASAATVAPNNAATLSPVTMIDGQPAIGLNEPLDRAWRRTGVALDRSGFTVEDRNMAAGRYDVRYVPPQSNQEQPGFLSRIFSSKKEQRVLAKYGISLSRAASGQTLIRVLTPNGQPAPSVEAEKILKLIAAELR
ncbi:MAG: outer membrane protein assembly factor BamC [Betaproteobacteria bacterium]|nr:outer membrane protein assembly factor BamC [Betaproteobacteria bacterium]